jgi:hypothetical protein
MKPHTSRTSPSHWGIRSPADYHTAPRSTPRPPTSSLTPVLQPESTRFELRGNLCRLRDTRAALHREHPSQGFRAFDAIEAERFLIATHRHALRYAVSRWHEIDDAFDALGEDDGSEPTYDVEAVVAELIATRRTRSAPKNGDTKDL